MADPARPTPMQRRIRPILATTLSADVDAELRARAAKAKAPVSRILDAALRRGLGMPPEFDLGPAPPPSTP